MADYNRLFELVAKKEGGYQNQSTDSGNYCEGKLIGTKYGVSAILYKHIKGKCPTVEEMKNLTKNEAKEIWRRGVWNTIKGDSIKSDAIAELILDSTGLGNSGYLHTRQAINDTLGTKIPATRKMVFTKEEIALINKAPEKKLIENLYLRRKNFFETHSQADIYGKGWMNRLNEVYNRVIIFAVEKKSPIVITLGLIALSFALYKYLFKKKN